MPTNSSKVVQGRKVDGGWTPSTHHDTNVVMVCIYLYRNRGPVCIPLYLPISIWYQWYIVDVIAAYSTVTFLILNKIENETNVENGFSFCFNNTKLLYKCQFVLDTNA